MWPCHHHSIIAIAQPPNHAPVAVTALTLAVFIWLASFYINCRSLTDSLCDYILTLPFHWCQSLIHYLQTRRWTFVCSLVADLDRALQLYRRLSPPKYTLKLSSFRCCNLLPFTAHQPEILWDSRSISSRLREQTRQRWSHSHSTQHHHFFSQHVITPTHITRTVTLLHMIIYMLIAYLYTLFTRWTIGDVITVMKC